MAASPDGVYHFRVAGTEMRETGEGKGYLQMQTEVVSGEHAGSFGPRHSWFIPEYRAGISKKTGKPYEMKLDDQKMKLANQVAAIVDGKENLSLTTPSSYDEAMLVEVGSQLPGKEFFGRVKRNDEGYVNFTRFYPLSAPPKGVVGVAAGGFSVDEL